MALLCWDDTSMGKWIPVDSLCLDGGGGDAKECFCLRTCCDRLMDLWLE